MKSTYLYLRSAFHVATDNAPPYFTLRAWIMLRLKYCFHSSARDVNLMVSCIYRDRRSAQALPPLKHSENIYVRWNPDEIRRKSTLWSTNGNGMNADNTNGIPR